MDYSNRNQNDRNNDSFNDRDQNRRNNDDSNFGRGYSDSRSQYENSDRNRNRRDDMGGNDYQNRNWRDDSMSGRSNRGNEGYYNENESNQLRRQGFSDRGQGYGNDRNQYENDWRNSGSGYGNDRGQNSGGGGRQNDRGWFDRTKDEVSSWFGDDDAERRRRMDKMTEGQHRGKGPKGYKRSDDRLKEDINDRLSDDQHVDASDIEVAVSNGEVTLSGTVDRREVRRRAEDIAESVSGVTHVQNNLRVGTQAKSGTDKNDISYGTPSSITGSTSQTANTGTSSTESSMSATNQKSRSTH